MEYRKQVELDPNTDYWFVQLGELRFFNGGSSFPFPCEKTARTFAENHKWIARSKYGVDRLVQILHPDGTLESIELDND